jgi:DNA-binding GntR family transcriptional regulator
MKLTREEQKLVEAPLSRKDAVLQFLRGAILDGRLSPGTRLDQDELASRLSVSRMPVREALKQLESERLVVVYPYRGVEVAGLDPSAVAELFAIRVAIEKLAVRQAVPNLKPPQIARMRKILTQMDRQVKSARNDDSWMRLNQEFHAIVNEASGWPNLVALIEQHRGHADRYVRTYLSLRGREQAQREHWELLEACSEGRPAIAEKVIERHLANTGSALVEAIEHSSAQAKRATARPAIRRRA